MTEVFLLVLAMIMGAALGWLLQHLQGRGKTESLRDRLRDRLQDREQSLAESREALDQERRLKAQAQVALAAERERSNHLQERMAEHKQELGALQQQFQKEFRLVADQLLEEKSRRFTLQNKEQLAELLNPLRDRIKEFEDKAAQHNKDHLERNTALKTEIQQLKALNMEITREAAHLARALTGESKTQGDWGEVVLERILEQSGLSKGREYEIQPSIRTAEGKVQRPDVIVYLPGERAIIVDSKVSLTDYERYTQAAAAGDEALHLKNHLASLRRHISELSTKRYQDLLGDRHPEFVLLFVPIEPAFYLATRSDSELYQEALQKNIVLVSTSTLIATLMMINTLWRREQQNLNALRIARESGKLYDKFVSFVSHLEKVGRHIKATEEAYEQARRSLTEGRGNLVKKAEQIRKLGASNSKQLEADLRAEALDVENTDDD